MDNPADRKRSTEVDSFFGNDNWKQNKGRNDSSVLIPITILTFLSTCKWWITTDGYGYSNQ